MRKYPFYLILGLGFLFPLNLKSEVSENEFQVTDSIASDIEVKIDFGQIHNVNKAVYGVNSALPTKPYEYSHPAFIEKYLDLGKPAIRFPGGTYANYYDFESGYFIPYNGISAENMDRINGWNEAVFEEKKSIEGYSSEDFIEFTNQTDAEYNLVLNILSKKSTDTKRLMERFKERGQTVKYVEIGNELYFGTYNAGIPDIYEYMKRGKKHADAVRAVFPDAKIGAIIPSQIFTKESFLDEVESGNSSKQLDWLEVLPNYDFYDAVVIHIYASMGMPVDVVAEDLIPYIDAYYNCMAHTDNKFGETFEFINQKFSGKDVWVTEYHVGGFSGILRSYRLRYSYLGGLFASNVLLNLFSVKDVSLGSWHSMTQLIVEPPSSSYSSLLVPEDATFGTLVNYEFLKIFREPVSNSVSYAPVSLSGSGEYTGGGDYGGTFSDLNSGFFFNETEGYLMVINKSDKTYSFNNNMISISNGTEVLMMENIVSISPSEDYILSEALESEDAFSMKTTAIVSNEVTIAPFSISRIQCKFITE